ncbi:PoNe immunity protein domain-containing protein, partial [Streptococcus pluranimalium]|uniref:PoNe immunity protein domain-containing protein n=1 Tax=Streptococcus pluranimalium TaxID=82348 RepID=UPI0039FBEBA3
MIKIGIRDELNTLENYQKILEFNREDNIYLLKDIESLKEDEKEGIQKRKFSNSEVIRNTQFFISKNFYEIFKVMYSAGYPLSDVRKSFLDFLEVKSLVLDGHIHYLDDLDIISVSILLDIDAETMAPFIENIKQVDYQDYLMDFLIRYY